MKPRELHRGASVNKSRLHERVILPGRAAELRSPQEKDGNGLEGRDTVSGGREKGRGE